MSEHHLKLHVDMRLVVRKNENISLTVMYDGIEKTCTGEISYRSTEPSGLRGGTG